MSTTTPRPMHHDTDDLRQLLCFNFYLGWRAIQAYYKPHFSAGMNPQSMYVLALLDPDQPSHVTRIAEALGIDKPAVSGLLDRMETAGLVRRADDPADGRGVHVYLTAEGQTLRAEHDERLCAADGPLFKNHVRPEDLDALRRIVRGLEHAHQDNLNQTKEQAA
ncbi:MAG: MarR family winged helix-turn-helix transcriptional regulator [Planctomycetota bacterium]